MAQRFRGIGIWAVLLVSGSVVAIYVVGLMAVGLWSVATYGVSGAGQAWLAQAAHPTAVVQSLFVDRQIRRYAWNLLMLGGCAVALGLLSRSKAPGAPQAASGYGSHGSGRWATKREIRMAFAGTGPGAVLGRLTDGSMVVFPWNTRNRNRFVLLIGPPGSGKTSRYTLPNLLHAADCDKKRSLAVTDPKGDLYRDTAEVMRKAGYRVLVLNLIDFQASLRYNPMDYVHSPEDAQRLAATIISNTDGPHGGGEPFWRHSEEALIACLIWYAKNALPVADQHLGTILHLAAAFAADPDLMADVMGEFDQGHSVRRLYGPVAGLRDKTRDGVFVGVTASRLKIWASDRITALTAASDFRFHDLAERPTVLYLIIPDHDATYRVLSSLFFDQCFQQLIALADSGDGRLKHEVRFMLEEMANIGRIPDLEKRLATIRSRGLIVEMVLQTLGQLKALYGDAWNTILGCSDTLVVLGANDLETAEYVSKRLGTTTIKITSSSQTRAERGGSEGVSFQYTSRPLMLPDEVQSQGDGGLRFDELLVIQRGMAPARLEKYPIDEFPGHEAISPVSPSGYRPPERKPVVLVDVNSLRGKEVAPSPVETGGDAPVPPSTGPGWLVPHNSNGGEP